LTISLFARNAAADWLPGGKANYVVSVASDSTAKLAYLAFSPGGDVSWSGWYWNKNIIGARPGSSMAVGAGTWVGEDCDRTGQRRYSPNGERFNNGRSYQLGAEGELRTAYSFTGPPTQFKRGRFAWRVPGVPTLGMRIDWDDGDWESWSITTAESGIQRLDLLNSSAGLGYRMGIAAGSNSSFDFRVHPDNTVSNPINAGYGFCTTATWVLNTTLYYDENTSNCSCSPKRTYKNYWTWRIGFYDRRDSYHFWCHCLSEGAVGADGVQGIWYAGGTHQSPMLQTIDDYGRFRGYVSVVAEPGAVGVEDKLRF
jgi:hypothetical protein